MLDTFLFACGAVLPIVLLIVLGYLLKRVRMLGEPLLSGLNRVCFRVLIPILLFRNIYGGDSITPTDVQAVLFSTGVIAVAFVGTIGFVGLIAPHLARHFVGNDHRQLLLASALTGSMLLIGAEILSRVVITPAVLPIGAITSFLGAPVFLYLVFKLSGRTKW